ncbi:hypothetical protein C8J55DRAFT_564588 [Lentinula edodes]|uniref:Uncharacterized protein n=1 Tax=Lentinula lateritia TaxID=40482 RepID=A0A9W8ZWM6_9AGAR|nr:hypothetical protein C8J55DRAFT_564588 [Lentinula edodes]
MLTGLVYLTLGSSRNLINTIPPSGPIFVLSHTCSITLHFLLRLLYQHPLSLPCDSGLSKQCPQTTPRLPRDAQARDKNRSPWQWVDVDSSSIASSQPDMPSDQAVNPLCGIRHPQDIPLVFLTNFRAVVLATTPVNFEEKPSNSNSFFIATKSYTEHGSLRGTINPVPMKSFIREVLWCSRASGSFPSGPASRKPFDQATPSRAKPNWQTRSM